MRFKSKFLLIALLFVPSVVMADRPVPSTVGNNLTAYSDSAAIQNNQWNTMTNVRTFTGNAKPKADFGNCNAIVLRCASPKCAAGGCTTLEIARPIVSGCVNSNSACKKYGNDLIDYISAQLVANSNAKAQQDALAQQQMAQQQAAQQNTEQMQQMQQQMQQMQQQNAETIAQLQSALQEQKQASAQATQSVQESHQQSSESAPQSASQQGQNSPGLTPAQTAAVAQAAVSPDIAMREQIAGEVMDKIREAELSLKEVNSDMQAAFEYAGCDKNGNNCSGPHRVKKFKDLARKFFEPYEDTLDNVYDALISARSVGADITDIIMMLNDSCLEYGKYLCTPGQVMHYDAVNCPDGISVPIYARINQSTYNKMTIYATVRGGMECKIGGIVPEADNGCKFLQVLTDNEEVERNWLYPNGGAGTDDTVTGLIRVGCASDALENSPFFKGRKKQASIDIETLEQIIDQDAHDYSGKSSWDSKINDNANLNKIKYCGLNRETYAELQKLVNSKQLPKKVCVREKDLVAILKSDAPLPDDAPVGYQIESIKDSCRRGTNGGDDLRECLCTSGNFLNRWWINGDCKCNNDQTFDYNYLACGNPDLCERTGGKWETDSCTCDKEGKKQWKPSEGGCVEKAEETNEQNSNAATNLESISTFSLPVEESWISGNLA